MKSHCLKLIGITAAVVMTACSSPVSVTDNIDMADHALSAGDYENTQATCDDLLHSSDFDNLSVDQLCRMSVIYLKLAERFSDRGNTAQAVICYRKALEIDPDSVNTVISSFPVEELQYTAILRNLIRAGEMDCNTIEADSIPFDLE